MRCFDSLHKTWVIDALAVLAVSSKLELDKDVLPLEQPSRATFALTAFRNAGDFVVYPTTTSIVKKDPAIMYNVKVAEASVGDICSFILSSPSGKLEPFFYVQGGSR